MRPDSTDSTRRNFASFFDTYTRHILFQYLLEELVNEINAVKWLVLLKDHVKLILPLT
ncbi:hypothetical protein SAMN05216167_11783 [Spirosoma endophyticum]|uniref:Uncharacterized protein n=1 Tax=Spirosoma endophyticum TaxID=662367 RepID=A0A1I2CGP2_9BACT|nr:hypothetical protein SAMN05216167_11783 [Spirosoma endophyticum]